MGFDIHNQEQLIMIYFVENQRTLKLVLFERGMDVDLVFFNVRCTTNRETQLQVGEYLSRAFFQRIPKFVR